MHSRHRHPLVLVLILCLIRGAASSGLADRDTGHEGGQPTILDQALASRPFWVKWRANALIHRDRRAVQIRDALLILNLKGYLWKRKARVEIRRGFFYGTWWSLRTLFHGRMARMNPWNLILTNQIRRNVETIRRLLREGVLNSVLSDIQAEYGSVEGASEMDDPVVRLRALVRGVADFARHAAGHSFDAVVYPCSGSDLYTAAAFADQIVTFSPDDLFSSSNPGTRSAAQDTEALSDKLKQKLLRNFHSAIAARFLEDYALELVLLEADVRSIWVLEDLWTIKKFHGFVRDWTSIQFNTGNRTLYHTHISGMLPDRFDAEHESLSRRLSRHFGRLGRVLILYKARSASWSNMISQTTHSILEVAPEGSILLTDEPHTDCRAANSEKSKISLVRLFDQRVVDMLKSMDQRFKIPGTPVFGYRDSLTKIGLFRIIARQA